MSGLLPNWICVIGLGVLALLLFLSKSLHLIGIVLACLWAAAVVSREVVIRVGRKLGPD